MSHNITQLTLFTIFNVFILQHLLMYDTMDESYHLLVYHTMDESILYVCVYIINLIFVFYRLMASVEICWIR